MKKLIPIFLLIFLLPVLASAQYGYFIWQHGNLNSTLPQELASAQYGYFVTDSTRMDTIILFDGGDVFNAQYCKAWDFDEYIVYTPYEIKEYGFSDGRVYVSSEIQFEDTIKRVFLERLSEGKNTIYYYLRKRAETYFFEKDSASLIKIAKRDINGISYRNQLLEATSDCPAVADAVKVIDYNKESMTKLIERYNSCSSRSIPRFRYGLTTGYNSIMLHPPGSDAFLNYFDYTYEGGYTIGLFADKPIKAGNFSFHIELYFSKNGMSYNKYINGFEYDFLANISSFNLPISLRYTYSAAKIRPFLNVGMAISTTVKNENLVQKTIMSGNVVQLGLYAIENHTLIANTHLGILSVGCGFEYPVNYRNSIFFETRYTVSRAYYHVKITEFNFVAGINL